MDEITLTEEVRKKYPLSMISNPVTHLRSKKVKSSMARSLPVENILPQNVGSIINYLQ